MAEVLIPLLLLFTGTLVTVGVGACFTAMDNGQRVRLHRSNVSTFFREWAVLTLMVLLIPFGLVSTGPRRSNLERVDKARSPVVLVPGYAMNRSCFAFLQIYLWRLGWEWVWPITNRPFSRSIPFYAERLGIHVNRLLDRSGADKVDLIGHSMGGVVAAFYVNELGGHNKVRHLITLGSPWRGTATWVFGGRREARDMAPGSDVIRAIQTPRVPTTAVWTRSDALVLPATNAKPDEGAESIELAHLGHVEMLASARVFRLIAEILGGRPAASLRSDAPSAAPPDPAAEPTAAPKAEGTD